MEYIIICDFDGTITMKDTVDAMAEEFAKGDWKKLNDLWSNGLSNGSQISQSILDMIDVDKNSLKEFIKSIKIDPYFKDFIEFIREKCLEFYILSDGFDFNIEAVLEQNEIDGLVCFTNILNFEDSKLVGCYPNKNEECGKCGNCKCNLIKDLNIENKKIIYIGDGTSDMCASGLGDHVFAKGKLANYLKEKNRDFINFENFKDIINHMKKFKY